MKIDVVGADHLDDLRGAVVIIDVLRAFTTAAYAFAAGAREIIMVASVDEAFALRARDPAARLMGEVGGHRIEGFDFGNSPLEMSRQQLGGVSLVFRTSSGTAAAVGARNASCLLVGSFVCAAATVRHLAAVAPSHVALVSSGRHGERGGQDDLECAEYLAAGLRGERADAAAYLARVRESSEAARFLTGNRVSFPIEDLDLALQIDRFDFAMSARRRDQMLVLERVAPAA